MPRPMRTRRTCLLFALALGVATTPALAAWSPDSVLTLGYTNKFGASGGMTLPAPGGDLYVVLRNPPASSASNDVARVTREGALVFVRQDLDWQSELVGVGLDGSGGLVNTYYTQVSSPPGNYDIAFRRLAAGGTYLPDLPANYWAEQSPWRDWFPTVASDPAGGAYVAWPAEGPSHYYIQRVTAAGAVAPGWPPRGHRLTPAPGPVPLALLADGSGGVYALVTTDALRIFRVLADTTLAPGWPATGVALSTGSSTLAGIGYPPDMALVNGAPGHVFAAWIENDGTSTNSNRRVVVRSFDGAGNAALAPLALTAFKESLTGLTAQADGENGLLVTWLDSGVTMVAHVFVDGSSAFSPFPLPVGVRTTFVTRGRAGGFIAFWGDASGVWAEWYRGDGTEDPEEPTNPRLVRSREAFFTYDWPVTAASDDDGGAFLTINVGTTPDYLPQAKMLRVYRAGLLDVGSPPGIARLALGIAPNPARRQLSVSLTLAHDGPASLEIIDLAGRRVLSRGLAGGSAARAESITLPSGLAPGVYLARLTQGGAATVKRFALID